MDLPLDRLQKPLRQLRKSLKQLSKDPPPEEVHRLRTRARHIEAIAPALAPSKPGKTRRLLKTIKPVRKAAGSVRDMDVLTGNALSLPQNSHSESLVRLIEHLGNTRQQSAGTLLETVSQQRKSARHLLKQYARLVRSAAGEKHSGSAGKAAKSAQHIEAAIAGLRRELARWPVLNAKNIHPFRLKVKELRSILQLLPVPRNAAPSEFPPGFSEVLGRVKDLIGDWHDWQQLSAFARDTLDARQDRALLVQIEETGERKLEEALEAANALRTRWLKSAGGNGRKIGEKNGRRN
jgi:CHAD domain-containing protein